jgi:hypothetical protein
MMEELAASIGALKKAESAIDRALAQLLLQHFLKG